MDEEAIDYAHKLFSTDGYGGDINEFKKLINTDSEALDYVHKLFSTDGYGGDINEFSTLVGVKNKENLLVMKKKKQS